FKVGESSSAAARLAGHTLAHTVDYGFIDTIDASIRASKSRAMTAVGVDDRALLGSQVSILRRERRYFRSMASSYKREAVIARQAWFRDRVCAAEAGPQDGPEDAASRLKCHQRKEPPQQLPTTTTPMTDAQLKALIAQGVADALAERDADRSRNVDVSHDPLTSGRRQAPLTRFF
ncbi:hypothetical protein Tco_1566096, partial [Tanacetum coccineum]